MTKDNKKRKSYKAWREVPAETSVKDLPPVPIAVPSEGSLGVTGDWRTFRPVIDKSNCNKCYLCWAYCPEGCIDINDNEFTEIDYEYCKGCGICAHECPKGAIELIREKKVED